MRRGWRPLRQRGLRSRSGQVSAVATILALLLFVSFLSTFVLGQLPGQMTAQEFQHQLQVEDQMERLQTSILAAAQAWQPGAGTLSPAVAWNQGNLCTPVAGVCTSATSNVCSPPLIYNESINSTTLTYDLTGSHDCITLNVLGSHDTILLEVTGSNAGSLVLTLNGTNDVVELNSLFSGSGFHASFYLYGSSDTYEGVGGPTGSNIYLNTYFIGESTGLACPYGNVSNTDSWSFTGATSSNSIQNLTWYNGLGYSTNYHATSGKVLGSSTTDVLGWQNVSAAIPCAFARTPIPGQATSIYLASPVTLNSGGVPPFGTPSSGSLSSEPAGIGSQTSFAVANVTNAAIPWNTATTCFPTASSTCTAPTGLVYYNFQGNSTTLTPTLAGCSATGCRVVYNVSGNSNTITFALTGSYVSSVVIQISGNLDKLTVSDGGTCNIRQSVNVIVSGNNDTYTLTMSGCTATGVGANLNTTFVGSTGNLCPYGEAAKYDKFSGVTWASSSQVYQNLTWRDADGVVTPPNTLSENGGHDELTFANTSGYYQCLFKVAKNTGPYSLNFLSGVKATMNNRYLPPSSVVYDQGAVILGVENGGSVMVSPPTTSYIAEPYGILFSLTLVSLVGVTGTATGYGTAGVIASVLSVQSFLYTDGTPAGSYLPYFYLNITTAYPQAWANFWSAQSAVVPTGTFCDPGTGVTYGDCLTPPLGDTSTIVVPINADQFAITSILAQVSIY